MILGYRSTICEGVGLWLLGMSAKDCGVRVVCHHITVCSRAPGVDVSVWVCSEMGDCFTGGCDLEPVVHYWPGLLDEGMEQRMDEDGGV